VKIYGKDLGVIKGKTIRKRPDHVHIDVAVMPKEKKSFILSIDIMYFTGLIFLVTV
jgi:hypothetical protein